jgi:hypothetical protein
MAETVLFVLFVISIPVFPKLMGREKFLKSDFYYKKIKNHKKRESEKTKQNQKRVKNKARDIRRILYGVPPPVYYADSGFDDQW